MTWSARCPKLWGIIDRAGVRAFVGAGDAVRRRSFKEPVRSEFMRVGFAIDCGFSATERLTALSQGCVPPGLDMVALALKVSQRTGAPLKDLLEEAARLVGDRIELQRTLDVKTSQARMSAHLVAGMPVAMIVFLTLLSSDFRKAWRLYRERFACWWR